MGKEFGERLRAWRMEKGISLYAIAKTSGVSAANLVSIEKGRRPASDDVLHKLANYGALQLPYETLKAWQALEEYSNEAIIEALRTLYPDPQERYQMIAQALEKEDDLKSL